MTADHHDEEAMTKKKTKKVTKKTSAKGKKTKAKKAKTAPRARTRPKKAHLTPPPPPPPFETPPSGGAIVDSTDTCVCGDAPEEHGRDAANPSSTSCNECEDCIAYEADPGPDAADPGSNAADPGPESDPDPVA
jgi:hypothetical protein